MDKATSREDLLIQRERLRAALQNIMGWLEGCEDEGEQIPPRYLTVARAALDYDLPTAADVRGILKD